MASIQFPVQLRDAAARSADDREAAQRYLAIRRERAVAFVAAARAYGHAAADALEAFAAYRIEVAQLQVGGRRLRAPELAEVTLEVRRLVAAHGPALAAAVDGLPEGQWLTCAGWFRGHALASPLPQPIARVGGPVAAAVLALLRDWGLADPRAEPGTAVPIGADGHNPLSCGRWPSETWAEVAVTRRWGSMAWSGTERQRVPGPLTATWVAAARAAAGVDERDERGSAERVA